MLSWATMLYGAALSAVLTAVLITLASRPRRAAVIVTAGASAFAAPLAWNAILRAAHGNQFFTDAPVAVMPASWQDTGSGVFTIALAAVALGLGPQASMPGRRVAVTAAIAGLAAFAVDVYLY